MIGPRSNAYASCKLAIPTALPKDMRGPIVELRALATRKDKRGKGFASALVAAVCEEADKARRFLFLHVKPDCDFECEKALTTQELANFYIKHGFQPIQAEPLLMLRPFAGAYGRQQ
jgi:GNAT superfamily N-acetyltransferase